MSTKRKYEESDSQGNVHASRQFLVPGSKPAKKKPRRFEPSPLKVQAHASSVNTIKKRIRDVRRKIEHAEELPANVRDEAERALAVYEQDLAEAEAEKTRQKMIKKYHMVRFFGKQSPTLCCVLVLILLRTAKGHSTFESATQAFVGNRIYRGGRDAEEPNTHCRSGSQLHTILSPC